MRHRNQEHLLLLLDQVHDWLLLHPILLHLLTILRDLQGPLYLPFVLTIVRRLGNELLLLLRLEVLLGWGDKMTNNLP
jgi:hypothetical protein